jgi:hypothetical protein
VSVPIMRAIMRAGSLIHSFQASLILFGILANSLAHPLSVSISVRHASYIIR